MNILIRADASVTIGSGHVMRCLTIATTFKKLGHEVSFWMEELPGHLITFVMEAGFTVTKQMQNVDILIVDHYQLGIEWERQMRPFTRKIIVIDDLADRTHDCDLLLDQNVVANYEHRYDGLVPEHCVKLLGPGYLMMRQEFVEERKLAKVRTGQVNRLLVFMGGSDPTGETLKALDAIQVYKEQLRSNHDYSFFEHVDVVVGGSNPDKDVIKQRCHELQLHYYCQINYLATLMRKADFAIGAGGSAMWERCYVGLPSSSTVVAANQMDTTNKAVELGAVLSLGWHEQVTSETYKQLLMNLPLRTAKLVSMSKQGLTITNGQSGANAWLQEMVGLLP